MRAKQRAASMKTEVRAGSEVNLDLSLSGLEVRQGGEFSQTDPGHSWINQTKRTAGMKEKLARSFPLAPTQSLTCTMSYISHPSPSMPGSAAPSTRLPHRLFFFQLKILQMSPMGQPRTVTL